MNYGQTLEEFLAEEIAADPTFTEGLEKAREETRLAVELARLREARGLTQVELAAALGVKQPQVARIERGQIPTVATLARLAQTLGAEFTIGASGRVTVKQCKKWTPPAGSSAAKEGRRRKPITAA